MGTNDLVIKILENLYKADSFKLNMKEIHSLGKKQEVDIVVQFLSEAGCIRHDPSGEQGYKLAPSGIAFLDKQKSEKNQHEFNIMVAFTGTIIALIGIYNFLKEDFMYHFVNALILKLVFLVLVLICVIPLIKIIFSYLKKEVLRG